MFTRLAIEADFDAIVEMAEYNVRTTRPDMDWDEAKMRRTLRSYIERAAPTFFVVEERRDVIGFLLCDMVEYRAATGLFTTQEVLFVRPDRRGTRAAVLLMKQLLAWSQLLGAKEIVGGNDNQFQSERTAKFLEHFGFERVGYAMRRVAAHGQQ
jgi:L-amino acid N-acyltransferase YncA